MAAIRTRLAEFEAVQGEWEAQQQQRDALQRDLAGLQGANEKLKEEADGINARLQLLDAALAAADAAHDHGGVPCPLCGAFLDPVARTRVREGYEGDVEQRRRQWRANKRRIDEVQGQITGLAAQIDALAGKLQGRAQEQRREGVLQEQLRGIDEATARIAAERTALAAVTERLTRGAYAEPEQAELKAVQADLGALAYDAVAHQQVRTELRGLASFEQRRSDLQVAEERQAADREQLAHEQEALAAHRARLAIERAEEARLLQAVAGIEAQRVEVVTQERARREAHGLVERLVGEEGGLQRQLEQVVADEAERAEKATALQQVLADKGAYDDLARAFGKSGVQAMIIEQVVPELAEDANTLLGRMTDQRMHLAFETQRQAKTRDSTIETLDIKITDGAGVARKYEMFSGGEAFRINFAVRIALSKLLARRAGAQLQTLIIDEGFGTQDAQGRERLVQAIRSIQPDFEKILVITHLDELKDEFSSRIDVVKTPSGSIAMVN